MKKAKIFDVEKTDSEQRCIYKACNYDCKPMMFVEFAICPTQITKELFKILLEKYNDSDNCSRISKKDIENRIDSSINEMDILRGMNYTLYDVQLYNNEYEETYVTYPVIIKTLKIGMDTIIQFDKNFKRFFDENFEL